METITYKPDTGRQKMRRAFGIIFGLFGGGMGCLFFFGGILVLIITLGSGANWQDVWPIALMFSGGGLFGAILFLVIGGVIGFAGESEEVQLTGEALIYTQGKKGTTLPFNAIARLKGERRASGTGSGSGHWVVVITDQFESSVELDVPQGVFLATFDTLPILQALLPRLPDTVEIDSRVQNYLSTGRMTR